MNITSVMTQRVRCVSPATPVKKVVDMMIKHGIGCVLVVADKQPTGIITKRDVLARVVAKNKTSDTVLCGDIMSSPILAIKTTDTFDTAVALMTKRGVKKLVVMDGNTIAGLVTVTDIFNSSKKLESVALKQLAQLMDLPKIASTEAG